MIGPQDIPPVPRRTRTALVTALASAVLILAGTPLTFAAPQSGSVSNSDSMSGAFGAARNVADLRFLEQTHFDDADHPTQEAALDLARAECRYLDSHGNTADNRIRMAEQTRAAVRYPYLFLDAAVEAICPWHRF